MKKPKQFSLILGLVVVLGAGCATIDESENDIDVSDLDAGEMKPSSSVASTGLTRYRIGKDQHVAEWIACYVDKNKSTFVAINPDNDEFRTHDFCGGWVAQAFLQAGFNIIGINRPGFGKTTPPTEDFAGGSTHEAVQAAVLDVRKNKKGFASITGVWGYGSGAIAAAFLAKDVPGMTHLIAGGGIYDLEAFYAGAKGADKKKIDDAKSRPAQGAGFFEMRSPAWDTEGLPKNILLYHAKKDVVVPVKQSESFRDTLASSEFSVKLNLVDNVDHNIEPEKHKVILISILGQVPGAKPQ